MNTHKVKQQARQEWLKRKRQVHGPDFLAGDDDGTNDNSQDLIVFGYSACLFSKHDSTRDTVGLINLPLNDGSLASADRFDIRHLFLPLSAVNNTGVKNLNCLPDPELNDQRFLTLNDEYICEVGVFNMDFEERRAFIEKIPQTSQAKPTDSEKDSGAGCHEAPLQCDGEGRPIVASANSDVELASKSNEPLSLPFTAPDGLRLPLSQRHFEIIESTARFVSDQPADKAGRMEIMIQGRQASNSDFAFLHRASPLHAFYLHLRWLMQTGLYGYNNSSDSSSDSDHSNSPEEGVQSSSRPDLAPECIVTTGDNSESPTSQAGQRQQEPIDPVELELPEDTQVPASQDSRALIDKVACLVAKSPTPAKLEQTLRIEKATASAAYAFLSPFDKLNGYYCFRRDCHINGVEDAIVEAALSTALDRQGALANPTPAPAEKAEKVETEREQQGDAGTCSTADDVASLQAKRRRLAAEFLMKKRQQAQQQ
ncbi:hypothetical protein EV174_004787 [Coemansia sp. RSA 2320]|nr:hypothetical protein EV174_004787 [Coemansia sp. RSA 2320]